MSQKKTPQTQKKNSPVAAPKPSANKKTASSKTSRITHLTAPQADVVEETSTLGDIQALPMLAPPDAAEITPEDANDAIAYGGEMDSQVEPPVDEMAVPSDAENDAIREDTNIDASADEFPQSGSDMPTEIVAVTPASEAAATLEDGEPTPDIAATTDPVEGEKPPVKKAKSIERQLRAVSPRYAAACAVVGDLRKGFIYSLNRKAAILGVERKGEAVPVKNSEIDAIDAEIREVRHQLQNLINRKKQLRGSSPELDEVNQTIRELSHQRQAARVEKKAAYQEAAQAAAIQRVD